MKSLKLSFENRNGLQLSASLDLPLGEKPKAYAVFAHCFTCGKNLRGERNISLALTQEGFAVFRFDFTGLGQSEGEFYKTNFSSNVKDLEDAASFLAKNYEAPQLIIGHSLGGAASLMAASRLDFVKAVATVGAPAEPAHVAHLFQAIEDRISQEGEAQVHIGGRPFLIQRHFLEDIQQTDLGSVIKSLRKPLLVMHSPQDTVVGIENAQKIYSQAWHPKSFVSLDGADHLLLKKEDSLYTGKTIAAWAARYIDLEEKEPLLTNKQAAVRTGPIGYTTEVRTGKHSFIADEPASVGGADLGPSPYDLLVAALGTCTSMTLRMYADRKGWDLQEVRVHLQHSKEHCQDCGDSENPKSKIDTIERVLELEGDLDEKQRARLVEIADRCPVHRTLHSEIKVNTTLAG
ncbi:MAG: alpha/beta fold hydrolase [Bacteroidia bacterium]|nr:alpha/beta fold hydrolase [Bacteroidia bacterium]